MNQKTKRILLVERDADTSEMINHWFHNSDYQVTTTTSYAESLRQAQTEAFDLYLLNDECDGGTTIDLCRQIRQFDQHTPVIFCSAYAYTPDRERGLSAGAQVYLTKPCDLNFLEQTIAQIIAACKITQQAVASA